MNIKKLVLVFILALTCRSFEFTNPLKDLHAPSWLEVAAYFIKMGSNLLPAPAEDSMPYFNVFPRYDFHILPNQSKVIEGICFNKIEISTKQKDNIVTLKI